MGIHPGAEAGSTEDPATALTTEMQTQLEQAKALDASNEAVSQLEMELLFYSGEPHTTFHSIDCPLFA